MNTNTLRFGVARAAALSVLLAAAAFYAESAHADAPVAPQTTPAVESPVVTPTPEAGIAPVEVVTTVAADEASERAARVELLAKVAASALIAPRGFVLVMPAALAQPSL